MVLLPHHFCHTHDSVDITIKIIYDTCKLNVNERRESFIIKSKKMESIGLLDSYVQIFVNAGLKHCFPVEFNDFISWFIITLFHYSFVKDYFFFQASSIKVTPGKMVATNKSVAFCWLRNDLRYHDNEVNTKIFIHSIWGM